MTNFLFHSLQVEYEEPHSHRQFGAEGGALRQKPFTSQTRVLMNLCFHVLHCHFTYRTN